MDLSAPRPIAFVLAASAHGSLIVNRNDYMVTSSKIHGVGHQILTSSMFDPQEILNLQNVLTHCRNRSGDGVVAIDGGANIGIHTIELARHMHGWGEVLAIEAQERLYYALCGNIALNNCFNARALLGALGDENSTINVPKVNYYQPASFGSLEIRPRASNEDIGQKVDYSKENGITTRLFTIDSLGLERLDVLKLDIEGMEMDALRGAIHTIRKCRPALLIEHVKLDHQQLQKFLAEQGYRSFIIAMSVLAIHHTDQHLLTQLSQQQNA